MHSDGAVSCNDVTGESEWSRSDQWLSQHVTWQQDMAQTMVYHSHWLCTLLFQSPPGAQQSS